MSSATSSTSFRPVTWSTLEPMLWGSAPRESGRQVGAGTDAKSKASAAQFTPRIARSVQRNPHRNLEQVALTLMQLAVLPGMFGIDRCYMGHAPRTRDLQASAWSRRATRSVRPRDCQSSDLRRCWHSLVCFESVHDGTIWHASRHDSLVHLRFPGSGDDLLVRGRDC